MKKFYPIIVLYALSYCISGCSDMCVDSRIIKKVKEDEVYYSGWNQRFILKRQDKEEERIGWKAHLKRLLEGRVEYSRAF